MNIFISHSQRDKKHVTLIAESLKTAGHVVWYDAWSMKVGDNLIKKINDGLKEADALIVIISKYSLKSKWVMHEFSALALGEISGRKVRIIPVLVDTSIVPSYLARFPYVDLTIGLNAGIQRILESLSEPAKPKKIKDEKRTYKKAIASLSQELRAGRLTLVCGAGVSIGAGIPSWNNLLLSLLESMMDKISENHSISLVNSHANDFQQRYGPSSLIIGKYLKNNLGNDFLPHLRDALYSKNPTSCDIIDSIVKLARPQRDGMPLDSVITFNFDEMIEENFDNNNIQHKPIFSEGIRNAPNELPIYHVHGYLPRKGKIKKGAEIVFSEDAYHSQFIEPFSWSNLIQLNKLGQNTCLFVGLSLSDPNMRRLLDVSNRKNPSRALSHYIIKKAPNFSESSDKVDELAFLLEEQDANELGLNVIWVSDFAEIANILKHIADANT